MTAETVTTPRMPALAQAVPGVVQAAPLGISAAQAETLRRAAVVARGRLVLAAAVRRPDTPEVEATAARPDTPATAARPDTPAREA